jgi:phospholipid/cholesterol/gamma-HCH transport system substrate-binding protein
METRANFILIGAFTLLVMLGVAGFVLWLGKFTDEEYAYYAVVFEEPVTGLSVGGAVQYNGIKVGEVDGLSLDPQNPARVRARIRVVSDTPVKQDTRAQLGFMGVTGVALIQLHGGSPESEALASSPEQLGVIIADASSIQKLIEGGGDVFANVNDLLLRMNRVFADENIARFSATMSHVEQVSASLANERESLEQILQDGAKAAANLERILARLDRASGGVESMMDNVDSAIDDHLAALFDDASATAEEFRQFSTRLNELLAGTQPHVEKFSEEGLNQLSHTLGNLSRLSEKLEQIARQLEEDPSAFLFNGSDAVEYVPQQ